MEAVDVHAVRQRRDVLRLDAEDRHRTLPVLRRHRDEVIREEGLLLQVGGPELAVPPGRPARGVQQLRVRRVQVARRVGVRDTRDGRGHRGERLAEPSRERGPRLDGVDQLHLGAVQVHDLRDVRPEPVGRVELGRQVMEVQHARVVRARGAQRAFPHRREVLCELGRHRREHDVRHPGAVLVGRVHRLRCRDRVTTGFERAHRVGRVEVVDVQAGEERRGVGLLPGTAE